MVIGCVFMMRISGLLQRQQTEQREVKGEMTKTIAEQNLPFVSPSDLRHPDEVMRLGRLGSAFPHRLSFMRVLMRQLSQQSDIHFKIKNQLDDDGYGRMVLGVTLAGRRFSLVAFSRPLAPENRTDRVIATALDACFCL